MAPRVQYNTVRYGRHEMVQFEDNAAAQVVVAMLLEKTATGFQPHSTAAAAPQRVLVAYEDRGVGMELHPDGAAHDQSVYEAGENMKALQPSGGAEFTMWLAGGNTAADGDPLVSDGAGRLRPADPGGTEDAGIVFEADHDDGEDVVAGAGAPELIDVVYTG